MIKSSRHQKIIGNFGEQMICNWLSRSGFEVALVDHTGIDIIAYNPATDERLGITVKARTRVVGKEKDHLNLYEKKDRDAIIRACYAFECDPWIAVYIEASKYADLFMTSLDNYESKYYTQTITATWKMRPKYIRQYDEDKEVLHIHLDFDVRDWF